MSKRKTEYAEVEIDQGYEAHVTSLDTLPPASVHDYALEPVKPERGPVQRQTWLPATTQADQQQAQRQQVAGQLRQMVDQQGQEPQPTNTGNRFVINEDTNAKDRAGAGFRWWMMAAGSLGPLGLGLGIWLVWGWGFFAFIFTFFGLGLLLGVGFLNWQSVSQSPVTVEKRQRGYDHEYRMVKEANAQRTREMVIGGFLGNARADVVRNAPTIDGQLLLTDSENEVRQ